MEQFDVLIVGSGLSGATIAQHYATQLNHKVLVIDKRDHIGGNVYDYTEPISKIRVSKYGAHLFHTNDKEVWDYIQQFGTWVRWDHKVVSRVMGRYLPIPVNINTVNQLVCENITNSEEMESWLKKERVKIDNPVNGEQLCLSRFGKSLYYYLFAPYTYKQWGKDPKELDASVLARIPIRTNFDDRYFDDRYQALPLYGYTDFVQQMLTHSNITVRLNTDWKEIKDKVSYRQLIFTGPIDSYFEESGLEKLEYRSINFNLKVLEEKGFYQPNSVVNYPDPIHPYTRIVEYKHFLNQKSDHTVIVSETTSDDGEPYYPVPNERNRLLYEQYRKLTENEKNVHFIGRLASYKYFNMDATIRASMDYFNNNLIPKRVKLVIARYNESIDWADNYRNKIIYNKGEPLDGYDKTLLIDRPNVGREGETYLHHIISNYDNLDDYTLFVQGKPFDHKKDLFDRLNDFIYDIPDNSTIIPTSDPEFRYLVWSINSCNLNGCIHHPGLPLREMHFKIFGYDRTDDFNFGAGAQFVVSREIIRRHPKSFYENLISMVNHCVNPVEGFCLERLWGLILKEI